MAQYWFDGSEFFQGGLPPVFVEFFEAAFPDENAEPGRVSFPTDHGTDKVLDGWLRGVIDLDETQAARLEALVEAHNADNPVQCIFFRPADGTEHIVERRSPNRHVYSTWQ